MSVTDCHTGCGFYSTKLALFSQLAKKVPTKLDEDQEMDGADGKHFCNRLIYLNLTLKRIGFIIKAMVATNIQINQSDQVPT